MGNFGEGRKLAGPSHYSLTHTCLFMFFLSKNTSVLTLHSICPSNESYQLPRLPGTDQQTCPTIRVLPSPSLFFKEKRASSLKINRDGRQTYLVPKAISQYMHKHSLYAFFKDSLEITSHPTNQVISHSYCCLRPDCDCGKYEP